MVMWYEERESARVSGRESHVSLAEPSALACDCLRAMPCLLCLLHDAGVARGRGRGACAVFGGALSLHELLAGHKQTERPQRDRQAEVMDGMGAVWGRVDM